VKLYTKKGDTGFTFNLKGEKLSKNSDIIHLSGTLDELISHLGMVKAIYLNEDTGKSFEQSSAETTCEFLNNIQKNLTVIMSAVSAGASAKELDADILIIEKEIDSLSDKIPRQTDFVLPGKNILEAQIHITRTVARRAERLFFAVMEEKKLCPEYGIFLNRLSDYLFVLSLQDY